MDNWNDPTPRQHQYQRGERGQASEYAGGGDPAAERRERQGRDYRPAGEAYPRARGARGRHRGGPPPRGAFPGRGGRGRRAPAPFSVDAEEFVPRSRQSSRVDGTNWEDAPEFIPAAQQQQVTGPAQETSVGGADAPPENCSGANGVVNDSGSTNSSSNNNNNNKGDGSSEEDSAGGEGEDRKSVV